MPTNEQQPVGQQPLPQHTLMHMAVLVAMYGPDRLRGDEIDWTEEDDLIADIAWAKLRIR